MAAARTGPETRTLRALVVAQGAVGLGFGASLAVVPGPDRFMGLAVLLGAWGMGAAFGQLPAGLVSDYLGRRRTVGGLLLLGVLGALLAGAPDFVPALHPWGAAVGRILLGLTAALWAPAVAWVRDVVPGHRTGRVLGGMSATAALAPLLGVVAGVAAGDAGAGRWLFPVLALVFVLAAVVVFLARTDPAPDRLMRSGAAPESLAAVGAAPGVRALVLWAIFAEVGVATSALTVASLFRYVEGGLALAVVGIGGLLGIRIVSTAIDRGHPGVALGLGALIAGGAGLLGLLADPLLALGGLGAGLGATRAAGLATVVLVAPDREQGTAMVAWQGAAGLGLAFGTLLAGAFLFGGVSRHFEATLAVPATAAVLALLAGARAARAGLPR